MLWATLVMAGCARSLPASDAPAQRAAGGVAVAEKFEPRFAAPPRLATTAAELSEVKARPDFASLRDNATRAADPLVVDPPTMPDGWSNWIFYYACPDDGSRLTPLSLEKHECPKCKKVYTDERTVTAYRCVLNERCEFASLTLAWAYAYTGDDKYAEGVQRYLLKLARMYPTFTEKRDRFDRRGLLAPGGAMRYAQILDEAVGAVRYSKAYDLTRNSRVWTDEQRAEVESKFFRPTVATLLSWNADISNHQTWFNAGLISVASVLGDSELVNKTLTMKGGVLDQFQRSLGDDGFWYEGTMAYHNYALAPMIEIADATRRMGLKVHEHERLRLLIAAPLGAMYPNGSFPVTNDSDPASIGMFGPAFEWAWRTYKQPIYAQAAALGNEARLKSLMGDDAKVDWPPKLKSTVFSDIGLVYLRQGSGDNAVCAVADFGPHGGGHGHFDKLNLMLYAKGREWILDPGRLSYSHKEYKTWVKHTAAHNTVTLGGKSQAPCAGKLLWFKESDGWSACAVETDAVYNGSRLRRYLLLTPEVLVDVFDVVSAEKTQIDWLLHATADQVETLHSMTTRDPVASLGETDGYPHLTNVKSWGPTAGEKPWQFKAGDDALNLVLLSSDTEQVFTCLGIGYHVEQKTPTLVRRVQGDKARFVAVYDLQPGAQGGRVQHVKGDTSPGDRAEVEFINVAGGRYTKWSVSFDASGVRVKQSKP